MELFLFSEAKSDFTIFSNTLPTRALSVCQSAQHDKFICLFNLHYEEICRRVKTTVEGMEDTSAKA